MPPTTKKPTGQKKQVPAPQLPAAKKRSADFYLWAMLLVIICVSLIRIHLLTVPLERDEGEYAFMGKLLLNGMSPYQHAYSMKLPGTYMMYALIMTLFGKSILGIHLGLLFMNAGTMFLFFIAFRKLYGSSVAFFAASGYGLMAMSGSVLGFAGHATHFVVFFVALGILFIAKFYKNTKRASAFMAGLFFGLSFLMKQQALFFILFGGIAVLLPYLKKQSSAYASMLKYGLLYSAGALLPYLTLIFIFKLTGSFDRFWFWTMTYASKYATGISFLQGQELFKISFLPMWKEFAFFWVLFVMGFGLVFANRMAFREKILAVAFALCAFLTICPGLYFRQHYFVCLLPAIGLLGALSLSAMLSIAARWLKIKTLSFLIPVIFLLCFVIAMAQNKEYYFQAQPEDIVKTYYSNNPFVESVDIAAYIKENSSASDNIAVIGSEPQIYFYSDRPAATGYLYTYPLVELHPYNLIMQKEMIAEIQKNRPAFIVRSTVEPSWLYHPGAPRLIYEWADQYLNDNYDLKGIVDLTNPDNVITKWNDDTKNYRPAGADLIKVYKRR